MLDYAVSCGQPEAGAFALFFSREERLKNMGLQLGVHPTTCIRYLQHGIGTRNYVGMAKHRGSIQFPVSGFDGQLAAIGHGVPRVDHQIENHLFDLAAVSFHRTIVGRKHELHLDIFTHQPTEHFLDILDDCIQV